MAEFSAVLPPEPASAPLPPMSGPSGEGSSSEPKPMSKNALKKAAKNERFAAIKLERRAREKEAKKEKKRIRAAKRSAGELDEEEEEEERTRRAAKKRKVQFGGTVLVDLGFDEMMNEKEVKSLCSQLAYTHSANRQASFPFSLIFTSLNGRTYKRLESLSDASYKRWANTQWWSESYEHLWKHQESQSTSSGQSASPKSEGDPSDSVAQEEIDASTVPDTPATKSNQSLNPVSSFTQDKVVYLTADTEDELTELKPDEVYIIGGICDHNRYKNLCLNKAKESGVRTARLPIGRYLASLPTRKVLTVNQVFEILVKWVETKDWEASLYSVIPKRKFTLGGKGSKVTSEDPEVVEEEQPDVDEVVVQDEEESDEGAS